MISREQTEMNFQSVVFLASTGKEAQASDMATSYINKIYDSIGTCRECAYCDIPHVREPASPCCTINYSSSHYWQEVELNGYCSKFKRKDKA